MSLYIDQRSFNSCDIIEPPYLEEINTDTLPDNPTNVLLLEFTGHTCKSCPKAHRTIDLIQELYGDRVIPVAFHLGYFSIPIPGESFNTDFRTPEGNILEQYYTFVSFPIGAVQSFASNTLMPHASWSASVSEHVSHQAPIKIELDPQYLPGLSAVQCQVTIETLTEYNLPSRLALYLIEDHIIDWQKDEEAPVLDVPNYEHNHVFRTSFNSVWGEPVELNCDAAGKIFEGEYSLILEQDWIPENCQLVALVYCTDRYNVIQVESVHLTEE